MMCLVGNAFMAYVFDIIYEKSVLSLYLNVLKWYNTLKIEQSTNSFGLFHTNDS